MVIKIKNLKRFLLKLIEYSSDVEISVYEMTSKLQILRVELENMRTLIETMDTPSV